MVGQTQLDKLIANERKGKNMEKSLKKNYMKPEIFSYEKEELADLIEAGACSSFTCHCHSGTNNTGR